jgi:molecular chaperone GrpE
MTTENSEENLKASAAKADKQTAAATMDKPVMTSAEEEEAALTQLQSDLERFRDLALRSQADFDNYRKRSAREKEDAVKFANASLLERLIPIIDNFELGLAAAAGGSDKSPIVTGMSMVAKPLNDFLADFGVTPIDATGQKFDPNLHEAIAHENDPKVPEGTVIRQVRKGFKLKDRLLRPANVIVSSGT